MKEHNKALLSAAAGAVLLGIAPNASAVFGMDSFDIAKYCQTPSPRQTFVYIDDKALVKGEKQWADNLYNKLKANLMPSEPLTLIKLSAENGATQDLWKGCFPNYSAEKLQELTAKGGGFFSVDPIKQLKEQQAVFWQQFGAALGKLLEQSSRERGQVQIDAANPPAKNIIRTLANDGARFTGARGAIRAVVYSDMIEKSDLGYSLKSSPNEAAAAAEKLKVNVQNAVFYVYGTGSTLAAQEVASDGLKPYWEAFLNNANGHLAVFGVGSDLTIPATTPENVHAYGVTITVAPNDIRQGRLHLFSDRDGRLQDSFLTVETGHRAQSLLDEKGSFICRDDACTLSTKLPRPVITKDGSADINLTGDKDNLKGQLQIPNAKLPDGRDAAFEMSAKIVTQ